MLKVGDRVKRGPEWGYGNQDHHEGVPCLGTVTKVKVGWVDVEWDSGEGNDYPANATGVVLAYKKSSSLKEGDYVVRGPDWLVEFNSQDTDDHGHQLLGTVSTRLFNGWYEIKWIGKRGTRQYRCDDVRRHIIKFVAVEVPVGTLVRRGPDWRWGTQDEHFGVRSIGRITGRSNDRDWYRVKWASGREYSYRYGAGCDQIQIVTQKILTKESEPIRTSPTFNKPLKKRMLLIC
jgi:hypothetical protein